MLARTLAFLLLVTASVPAWAQSQPAPPAQLPPASAPPGAAAPANDINTYGEPAYDPQTRAALDRLLSLNETRLILDQIPQQITPYIVEPLTKANPGKDKQISALVLDTLTRQMAGAREPLAAAVRLAYYKRFNVAELNALADFYSTPLGQKYVANLNALQSDIARVGVPLSNDVVTASVKAIVASAKVQGLKIPPILAQQQ